MTSHDMRATPNETGMQVKSLLVSGKNGAGSVCVGGGGEEVEGICGEGEMGDGELGYAIAGRIGEGKGGSTKSG